MTSNEKINQALQTKKKKDRNFIILVLTLIIGGAIIVFTESIAIGIPFAIVGFIIIIRSLFFPNNTAENDLQAITEELALAAVKEALPQMEYSCHEHIPTSVLRSDMGYSLGGSDIHPRDLLKGLHDGQAFELTHLSMTQTRHRRVNEHESETETVTVFSGMWITTNLNKHPQGTVIVATKSAIAKKFQKKAAPIGSEAFDALFAVKAEYPDDLIEVLDPITVQQLIQLKGEARGDIYVKFLPDGETHIAVNGSPARLAITNYSIDAMELRAKFIQDAYDIRSFLDTIVTMRE